ncbi:hypothetical protein SZ64_06420 [Erythrobacter sp. SG61-1L]|uniref:cell division protein ZapA n=1 Tax=Erythrobacter sp. SG61-1L TaxID=1603897 RepID=UPI0006C91622|nr:cell division protein ZapA [Erythrobacter sp. SG61-1L]KPL67781.1 hypothetical protein SZ64_06420 [Erythrobacter sp. SG61-1L]
MSNVQLTIGGRTYTVSCQDGQEGHIARLGQAIEAKVASLKGNVGQSEPRTLLFAALLLADEAHDLRNRLAAAPAPTLPLDGPPIPADRFEALAERLEKLAESLEG